MVEIWIAEELFNYLHPFLFSDIFQQKLTKHQFQVLFEIIKTYSFIDLRKEFNITQFLDNYLSVLSNQYKRQIKEYFIQYDNRIKLAFKLLNASVFKSFRSFPC